MDITTSTLAVARPGAKDAARRTADQQRRPGLGAGPLGGSGFGGLVTSGWVAGAAGSGAGPVALRRAEQPPIPGTPT